MYNAKFIVPGVIVFLALFTAPFWLNAGSAQYKRPAVTLPLTEKECVESREFMASEHMQLLDTWRDMALREEKRAYVSTTGKTWNVSLQNTCMSCHSDKAGFCDSCHNANSVDPYCWDCHVEPKGKK